MEFGAPSHQSLRPSSQQWVADVVERRRVVATALVVVRALEMLKKVSASSDLRVPECSR
jgi:hypothetical protein